MLAGDRHDCVHVAGRVPHMHGNDRLRVRPDDGADGLRRNRDALVDIDDDRNGSNRQNGRGGRHIGVGGNDDFVAWANAHRGQARRQREGAAGRESEMTDVEVRGVSLLERRALALFAVPEQLARSDDRAIASISSSPTTYIGVNSWRVWSPSVAEVRNVESANPRLLGRATFEWRLRCAGPIQIDGVEEVEEIDAVDLHWIKGTPSLAPPARRQCRVGTPERRRRTRPPGSRSPTRRTERDSSASQ
jgi:hypothetical protein